MIDFILARLKEQSTWRGIILILTGFGVAIEPEKGEAIIAVGLSVVGLINVLRKQPEIRKALPVTEADRKADAARRAANPKG